KFGQRVLVYEEFSRNMAATSVLARSVTFSNSIGIAVRLGAIAAQDGNLFALCLVYVIAKLARAQSLPWKIPLYRRIYSPNSSYLNILSIIELGNTLDS